MLQTDDTMEFLSMHWKTVIRLGLFLPAAMLACLLSAMPVCAAGTTLIPADTNTGLKIENAVVSGDTTSLLFWTYPNIGDPGAGKDCPLNFYTVSLAPGLPDTQARTAASNVCGNGLSRARLLANNDVLILVVGRLERWRDGAQISSTTFAEIPATSKMGIDAGNGGQWHGMTATGDVLLAVPGRAGGNGKNADVGLQVVSLDADGDLRWQTQIGAAGQTLMTEKLWATTGGGAVIRAGAIASDYSSTNMRNLLYFIDAGGALKKPVELTAGDRQPDMQTLLTMSPAEVQKEMQRMAESRPENIKKLAVDARADGGFDVLLQREGGLAGREGYFLMRFGADGNLQSEKIVTDQIASYGLDDVKDFHVDGRKLVLLSRVSASQPSVQSNRKTWSQNVIGIVDLDDATLETRLLPLDLRYLQAAMDAGDEQLQHIENWPGGEAVLLTRLGGLPLAVSRGHLSGRAALRLNEASADLPAFTEVFEQGRNDAARQAAREQRKAGQQASQAQLNADLAAAVGMTPEQFAALSDEDRKLVLTMGGNFDAITAAGLKQAASARAQKELPPAVADVAAEAAADPGAFSMTILDVFEIAGRGVVVTGRVDAGTVRVGDTVCLLSATSGKRELQVEAIEMGRLTPDSATAGDTPTIIFNGIGTGDVSRNDQLRSSCGNR